MGLKRFDLYSDYTGGKMVEHAHGDYVLFDDVEHLLLGHDQFKTGDAGAPDQIKDSNGEVVLGSCRVCGKAESELDEPCESKPLPAPADQGQPSEGSNPNACDHGYAPLTPADVEQLRSALATANADVGRLAKERDDAIIKYTGQVNVAEQNYKKALARTEQVRTDLTTARRELGEAKAENIKICQLVASMYEAATGRKGECPNRGVVEDMADVRAEVLSLTAKLAEAGQRIATDCPEADATDLAHPAWWRGHDYTTKVFCQKVNEILDGKDQGGGVAGEPWESTRQRLHGLVQQLSAATAANVERDRAAEAMEAIANHSYTQVGQDVPGQWWARFGSGGTGYGPTSTDAILAARDAAEGNG